MTAESELRPTPQPWGQIELTPEIVTPEKRLGAVLNIIQNGAQTLTVLTMPNFKFILVPPKASGRV